MKYRKIRKARFQKLYADGTRPTRSNVYHIDADDTSGIRRLLKAVI